MKATGITRRIDDLGRVVIPRDIRRTLRIREGDPLEIFVEDNGEDSGVIFRKYNPGECLLNQLQRLTDEINEDDDLPWEVKKSVREALRSAYNALKASETPT